MVTLFATLCMVSAPAVCIQEIVTDSKMSSITISECMGVVGMESARKFATEHPSYATKWSLKGWQCQLGERINERKA